MSSHPINLGIRFLLELIAITVMGVWGWRQGEGLTRFILALGIPIIAAIAWGTFAVPNDPSRSGKAPIATSGILRLILELTYFAVAVWFLQNMTFTELSWVFGAVVVIHYLVSYDRVMWLVKQ